MFSQIRQESCLQLYIFPLDLCLVTAKWSIGFFFPHVAQIRHVPADGSSGVVAFFACLASRRFFSPARLLLSSHDRHMAETTVLPASFLHVANSDDGFSW